jgi:4-amino-4-deoxy-L-arabinose transferase-like glycosyltransferase
VILITLSAWWVRVEYNRKVVLDKPIRNDARRYVKYGYNLSQHGIFSKQYPSSHPQPDAFCSPGYPLLIALSISIGGSSGFYFLTVFVQSVISALLVCLTYLIGIRMLPLGAVLVACILVAFSPHLISMTSYLLTETLFSFVLMISLWLFYMALQKQTFISYTMAAVLFGLTYLTNQTVFFMPLLFALIIFLFSWYMPKKKRDQQLLLKLVVFLFIFLLFPTGWLLRNMIQLRSDSTTGYNRALITVSHGTYPGFFYKNEVFKYYPYDEDPLQPAFSQSWGNFRKILWARVKQRPLRYLSWYFFEKPYYFWSWDNLQSQWRGINTKGHGDIYVYPVLNSLYLTSRLANLSRVIMKCLHPLILSSTLIGFAFVYIQLRKAGAKQDISASPVFIFSVCLYYTMLYSVFAPYPRYSVPLRPQLYLSALWTSFYGWKLIEDKWRKKHVIR